MDPRASATWRGEGIVALSCSLLCSLGISFRGMWSKGKLRPPEERRLEGQEGGLVPTCPDPPAASTVDVADGTGRVGEPLRGRGKGVKYDIRMKESCKTNCRFEFLVEFCVYSDIGHVTSVTSETFVTSVCNVCNV